MSIKLFLRPHSVPVTNISPKLLFSRKNCPRSPKFLIISFSSLAAHNASQISDQLFSYGPSLHKGSSPFPVHQSHTPDRSLAKNQDEGRQPEKDEVEERDVLCEESFTRVFDVAALRVPSKDCFELESRLRGHLLNWPRIRNVARVPGDEVEEELVELVGNQNGNGSEDYGGAEIESLHRRIYGKAEGDGEPLSPALYREKLARTFNSRGFVKFRNLAKMSRPKRRKKKEEEEQGGDYWKKRSGKNKFAFVEVVEDEDQRGEDMKGLLGDGFKGGRWRSSTRLLLLDERYADKGTAELPGAIKVAVSKFLTILYIDE